jgi:DNA-directed RNA polymerase specialized sigma24 family protein
VPLGTAKSRLHRGLGALRRALAADGELVVEEARR